MTATARKGAIIYPGVELPDTTTVGHFAIIRGPVRIGENVSIGSHTEIAPGCVIGDGVRIHSRCFIAENTVIHDNVWIGPGVLITNCWHPRCEHAKDCMKGATIYEDAIIGGGVTILPQVWIGSGAVVGAGTLVTRNVGSQQVVYGMPDQPRGIRRSLKCKSGRKVLAYDPSTQKHTDRCSVCLAFPLPKVEA